MKPILTSVLILATFIMAQARLIPHWTDQELLDQSDLVVIATPTTSADTQERTELPGLLAQHVIGVETGFAVIAVVKGDKALKHFVLHHYRSDEGIVNNGPNLVSFNSEEKRKFLLFLKREADGRYAPTVGQLDPGIQGITELADPVSADSNPSPLAEAAKPTQSDFEETNILAAGDWSEPVAGVPGKNPTRGSHSPIIRGRLLLCQSPKNHQPAVYLELQDCGGTWGGIAEIYCDMVRFGWESRDANGQLLSPKEGGFGGGRPGAHWMTLPCDSTIRLRISPYASFSYDSTDDYFISGSFVVVNPPADHTGLGVWQGTLKLPAMKIVVTETIPDAAHVAPALTSTTMPLAPEGQAVPAQQTQAANQTTPLSYRDPDSGITFLVESDRHHVVALDKDGKILWCRQPATDGKLPPYSKNRPLPNPAITWLGSSTEPRGNSVGITFRSRQFGSLDLKTGDFTFHGQD